MDDQRELDYRNLLNCRIEIASSSGSALHSSVRLPQECYNAANISLPTVYDFALEKSILQKHNKGSNNTNNNHNNDGNTTIISGTTLEEDAMVAEMKSVTNANDQVCVEILQNNHYDLKTSIEAFFQSPSGSTTKHNYLGNASAKYNS